MIRESLLGSSLLVAFRTFDATRTARTFVFAAVVVPVVQVVYFAAIATEPGQPPPLAVAVSSVLLVTTVAAVEASTVAMTHMRFDGVLPHLLLAPRKAFAAWVGMSLASAAVGVFAGLVSLVTAFALFHQVFPLAQFLAASGLVVLIAVTSGGFGLALGVLTLPTRNGLSWIVPVLGALTVLGGIAVPVGELPQQAQWVARLLPISYGTDAARGILAGECDAILPSVLGVVAVGFGWAAIGLASWRLIERRVRIAGTADLL